MRDRTVTSIVLFVLVGSLLPAETTSANFRRAFHLAGIPKVRRDERVDINLTSDALLFQRKKLAHRVPYARVSQVLVLRADRNYEKSTYAAAVAFGLPGALLILKKHKVDTLVIEYENERGGRMGLAVQLERGQGQRLREMLEERGVKVTEPPLAKATDLESQTPPKEGVKP